MAKELEHIDSTGLTIYVKPAPVTVGVWAADAVAMVEEGASGYYYADVAVPADQYVVFRQAGGAPNIAVDVPGVAVIDTRLPNLDVPVSSVGGASGSGTETVNHNFGGADALRYVFNGVGVEGAKIQAFFRTDYDAGNSTRAFVQAEAITSSDGRWVNNMKLDPGNYTLVFFEVGDYGPDTRNITVPVP